MIAILSGLLAGAGHVWSGPDHLAAIAPIAVRQPQPAGLPGLRWGIGHSAGAIVIGLLLTCKHTRDSRTTPLAADKAVRSSVRISCFPAAVTPWPIRRGR